jgi:hypothetical protein
VNDDSSLSSTPTNLRHALRYMLDKSEFLSPHGIRALSRFHMNHPYVLNVNGMEHRVDYQPAESKTSLFGGNSNWRGPIWFPMNFLLVESLQKFHHYFGDEFKVEFPTGSGELLTLAEVAGEISRRLNRIFLRGEDGRRPVAGNLETFQATHTGRTSSCSTSISTATAAAASAQITKLDGQGLSPSCWPRAARPVKTSGFNESRRCFNAVSKSAPENRRRAVTRSSARRFAFG